MYSLLGWSEMKKKIIKNFIKNKIKKYTYGQTQKNLPFTFNIILSTVKIAKNVKSLFILMLKQILMDPKEVNAV